MDSITQIALGATMGELALGRKIGARAALAGAICGTLPDLDSFIPYQDAVATVTYHRSFSHSLIMLTLVSPLVAWAMSKVFRRVGGDWKLWWPLCFFALFTHPLLDLFTVYGTQLFWPISDYPFSGSTVFIIDPAYTLPLSAGVLAALFMKRGSERRQASAWLGLGVSSAYLVWTLGAKFHVEKVIRDELSDQGVVWKTILTTPAPFNSILWRAVVMAEGGYYEAWYSMFDDPHQVEFSFHADDKTLLAPIANHWPVQRLAYFTHGFYGVRERNGSIVMSDLRMGVEPTYTFNYRVADIRQGGIEPVVSTFVDIPWQPEQLRALIERVFQPARKTS
jgi:inner membrane protein